LTLKDATVRGYCGLAPPPTIPFNAGKIDMIIENNSDNASKSDDIGRTTGTSEKTPSSDKIVETIERKPKSHAVDNIGETSVNPKL
jgi:hypothetical protein